MWYTDGKKNPPTSCTRLSATLLHYLKVLDFYSLSELSESGRLKSQTAQLRTGNVLLLEVRNLSEVTHEGKNNTHTHTHYMKYLVVGERWKLAYNYLLQTGDDESWTKPLRLVNYMNKGGNQKLWLWHVVTEALLLHYSSPNSLMLCQVSFADQHGRQQSQGGVGRLGQIVLHPQKPADQ